MRSCCADRREAKPATGFCRNERQEAKPATGFIRKRKKLRIPWTESSEIAENCKFCGRNHQKSLKTANSVDRIIKKRKKPAFPTLGKVRITHFLRFPTLGKIKISHFLRFPLERKSKSPVFYVSP